MSSNHYRVAVHEIETGLVAVVADGAGGMAGAAEAAQLVLELVDQALRTQHFNPFAADSWDSLLTSADARVESHAIAGETTAVVVAVDAAGPLVGASVGDSGALVVPRNGRLDELTARQQKKRRLGSGHARSVTFERRSLESVLIIGSDGLLAHVTDARVAEAARRTEDVDEIAEELLHSSKLPSGTFPDDVSIVVVRSLRNHQSNARHPIGRCDR